MQIKSITLNNFRQFKGKQKLEFSCNPEKNVTVLLGNNTFGKTTILQAFNWCFYGVADFPKDSHPENLLNLEIANEKAGIEDKCQVSVEIVMEHRGTEYVIERSQVYIDRADGKWNGLKSEIDMSYKEDGIMKPVRKGEERNIINGILPQSLSGYFFFDTERVSDISTRKDLTEAVRGLLGLAAVGNARKHLGSRTLSKSAIGQWNKSLNAAGNEKAEQALQTINEQTERKEELERIIDSSEEEIKKLNIQKERISDILRDNQSTAELQKEKQAKEVKLELARKDLEESNRLFIEYYNNGAVNYFLLPAIEQAEQCLKDADVDKMGIRDLTEASIQDIIKRGRCICGAKIITPKDGMPGNEVYDHIMTEMKLLPPEHIGTAVNNYKQLLDNEKRNTTQFYPTIEQKYKEIMRQRNNIAEIEDRIAEIDKSIFGKENMSSYEADLNRIKSDIKRITENKDKCLKEIGACSSAIDSAQKIYDSLVSATERNSRLIRYIAYAENICAWIDDTYIEKEKDMRNRLQERVNDMFNRMYHGQRRVQIDKQYHVTLFTNVNEKEVVSGESEGLKRVKNFAFIAGLVDLAKEKASLGRNATDSISWENEAYPLVMDAPFSNADEIHIKNISKVLPEVANQVIMFVMEKDWQYAEPVMASRVGKYCKLNKISESHTEII